MRSRSAGNHRSLQWRLLLGVCLLAACTSWRVQHVSPADLLSREPPRLRVTRADRSRVELHRPQLVGDTIIDGRVRGGVRTKVPLNEVVEVAVRKWDPAVPRGSGPGYFRCGSRRDDRPDMGRSRRLAQPTIETWCPARSKVRIAASRSRTFTRT